MKRTGILFMTLLILNACNDHSSERHNNDSHEPHQTSPTDVRLNDGEKWQANTATTEGIQNMIALLDRSEYVSADSLSSGLMREYEYIFKNCTMEGEAHKQLHNYLIPLQTEISALNSTNKKTKVKEIEKHLHKYSNYFN